MYKNKYLIDFYRVCLFLHFNLYSVLNLLLHVLSIIGPIDIQICNKIIIVTHKIQLLTTNTPFDNKVKCILLFTGISKSGFKSAQPTYTTVHRGTTTSTDGTTNTSALPTHAVPTEAVQPSALPTQQHAPLVQQSQHAPYHVYPNEPTNNELQTQSNSHVQPSNQAPQQQQQQQQQQMSSEHLSKGQATQQAQNQNQVRVDIIK